MPYSTEQILVDAFWEIAEGRWRETAAELLRDLMPPAIGTEEAPQAGEARAELPGEVRAVSRETPATSEAAWQGVGGLGVPAGGSQTTTGETSEEETQDSVLETVASKVVGSALGMVPLAKALVGLFTGGDEPEPEPLVKFALPPSLRLETANAEGGVTGVDYDQYGRPRRQLSEGGSGAPGSEGVRGGVGEGSTVAPSLPQVVVQVQAMDSRSFMDHSSDIARAVREAMLNMHALNDVVSDL